MHARAAGAGSVPRTHGMHHQCGLDGADRIAPGKHQRRAASLPRTSPHTRRRSTASPVLGAPLQCSSTDNAPGVSSSQAQHAHDDGGEAAWARAHPGWPEPPQLPSSPQATFNPVTLAYLGDAVWELLIRQHAHARQGHAQTGPQEAPAGPHPFPGQHRRPLPRKPGGSSSAQQLHTVAASYANASQQALLHDLLLASTSSLHSPTKPALFPTPTCPPSPTLAGASNSTQHTTLASIGGDDGHAAESVQGPGSQQEGQRPAGAAALPVSLSAEEVEVLRWARNSSAVSPPKGVDSLAYKKATALEVLVAHLYLTDADRCKLVVTSLLDSVQQQQQQQQQGGNLARPPPGT